MVGVMGALDKKLKACYPSFCRFWRRDGEDNGWSVTFLGSGWPPSQGDYDVEFFYRTAWYYDGCVDSWSSTKVVV